MCTVMFSSNAPTEVSVNSTHPIRQGIAPRGWRDDMPPTPQMAKIAQDLRQSADGSAVRTSLVAGDG